MMLGPCFLPIGYDDVPQVAVALGRTGQRLRYLHSAILYRAADQTIWCLEFTLNGEYQSSRASQHNTRFAWAIPKIDQLILRQVAAYCESVAKRPQRFTYSFAYNQMVELAPDKDQFTILGGTEGFTCATFVLAIFNRLRVHLLDSSTWFNDTEDEVWQQDTLDLLRRLKDRLGLTDECLQRRADEIPCLRYPPHALIGACRVGMHPTDCKSAREAGKESLAWLDTCHAMMRPSHA
jgi:hypothetical protein